MEFSTKKNKVWDIDPDSNPVIGLTIGLRVNERLSEIEDIMSSKSKPNIKYLKIVSTTKIIYESDEGAILLHTEGKNDSDKCLLELSPMPSDSSNEMIYNISKLMQIVSNKLDINTNGAESIIRLKPTWGSQNKCSKEWLNAFIKIFDILISSKIPLFKSNLIKDSKKISDDSLNNVECSHVPSILFSTKEITTITINFIYNIANSIFSGNQINIDEHNTIPTYKKFGIKPKKFFAKIGHLLDLSQMPDWLYINNSKYNEPIKVLIDNIHISCLYIDKWDSSISSQMNSIMSSVLNTEKYLQASINKITDLYDQPLLINICMYGLSKSKGNVFSGISIPEYRTIAAKSDSNYDFIIGFPYSIRTEYDKFMSISNDIKQQFSNQIEKHLLV